MIVYRNQMLSPVIIQRSQLQINENNYLSEATMTAEERLMQISPYVKCPTQMMDRYVSS